MQYSETQWILDVKGNFTNPKLFVENGGHITIKQREIFNFINDTNASFQQYFRKYFNKPYDNFASITLNKCDFIIRYENINEDYLSVLQKSGIKNLKPLPIANKTYGKKNDLKEYYTEDIQDLSLFVFGPFMTKYHYEFPEHWKNINIPISSFLLFRIGIIFRKIKWKFKKSNDRKSLKGTIYGDIQRKKTKRH